MLFSQLAQSLLKLHEESSRTAMTEQLAELLKNASPHEAYHISYLILGYLKAPYKKNNQFNFAQKSVKKVIADLLNIEINEIDHVIQKSGDLGFSLFYLDWLFQDSGLTIEQVFTQLSDIQEISGIGAQEKRAEILANLLKNVDALSAAFILRIVLGTMRLGFSDMTFIDSLSWMLVGDKSLRSKIEHAYNICADVGLITQQLKENGIGALENIDITLGVPIRPASAERLASADDIIDKIGPCYAEPKLDGFRVQVQIDKNSKNTKFWFFSRNMQDMSDMFPEIKHALSLLNIKSIIAEGEAIVYDEATQSFLPFQQTVKRKRKHDIESVAAELPLRFYFFDILYLNGESQLNKTYLQRRQILENLISQYNKIVSNKGNPNEAKDSRVIHLISSKYCETKSELQNYFIEQISKGLEGIVVKKAEGIYRPGKRDFNWIKLKRQQIGSLSDSIDAVILGYYYGGGKRAEFGIGAFLAGIFNPEKDRYETIARVGTGLTDAEWKELKNNAEYYKVLDKPANVMCVPELVPDVWVIPKIVTILIADEITKSPMHTAARGLLGSQTEGLALRFPRFEGYSVDKEPTQATTTKEVIELYELQYRAKS